MHCLCCLSEGPFAVEHVIPESLGNDDLVLEGQVCAGCNNHFSKLEEYVLQKTPIAFWRTHLGIRSKRDKLLSINLSQPKREKGVYPSVHPTHDKSIGFAAHEDGSTSVDIDDLSIINQIVNNKRHEFQFVITPKTVFILGRFLCKVGVELLCISDQELARTDRFERARARRFARFGDINSLWPIFHFSKGNISDFRKLKDKNEASLEEVICYEYRLLEVREGYILARLSVGTDNWIVCLNDPLPTAQIRHAFPEYKLQCIWYSSKEIG